MSGIGIVCPETSVMLLELLAKARNHKMTPAERDAQQRSFARGQMGLDHPEMSAEEIDRILREVVGPPLSEQLASERAAGRLEGIREAAEVARGHAFEWDSLRLMDERAGDTRALEIATAIEALASKETTRD